MELDAAEFGQHNRVYITDYIKFGDAKAGALIGAGSALSAALGVFTKEFLTAISGMSCWVQVLGLVCSGFVAISSLLMLWYSVQALSPKTPTANSSLASFPDVAGMSPTDYAARVVQLDAHGIAREYAHVNVTLSRIAAAKFASIARAVWWFRVQLVGASGILLIYVFRVATAKG